MIVAAVTREEFDGVREWLLANEGIDMGSADAGTITQAGVGVEYAFDGKSLRLTVVRTPFLVPKALIEGRIVDGLGRMGISGVRTS